jgi:SPP1 gp7 family putative phage head morphogenesis protein
MKAIALSRPFEGRVLKDWAANMQSDDLRRIHSTVQAGMIAGEDAASIARRVVGSSRLRGSDGTTEITRRQVQSVVRTAVQHIANGARDTFFNDNKDLFTAEQYVATLDSRTTPICRALDGKIFEVGTGPRPPLHFNCRSVRIAAIDGTLAGNRPAKPTTERLLVREYAAQRGLGDISSRGALPRGTKGPFDTWARKRIRELTGPIPAATTYQTWLAKQSIAFQNEILGKAKGQLFRSGGLKLDKFVDLNSGREFTLKELASKHAEAFRAAGLDPEGF